MIIQRRAVGDTTALPHDLPQRLKEIYASRGLTDESELSLSLSHMAHFNQLTGIDRAVELLQHAFATQQRIMIVGDFDTDGATSTALLVLALREFGYTSVNYLVPNRFDDGYGLTPTIVDQILPLGVDLLITVDNGITSIEGVAYAKQAGLTVLVTDHHLAGIELPCADAIVNPNLPSCSFPSKALAGVGVSFYLMAALRHARRLASPNTPQPNIANYLDLVALGTVADVVPLDRNNRILIQQGLLRIRSGTCRPGILALLHVAKRSVHSISSQDLAFSVAPRLNAAGRLDQMSFGVDLLLSHNPMEAEVMAQELDLLNQTRKEIEQGMKIEALNYCQALIKETTEIPCGITLYQDDWHQGVIGIIASRIKDEYHRPTIAFALDSSTLNERVMLKGSARSIKGFHLRDALDRINAQYPDIMVKFGGHAMAAGLTLYQDQFELFSQLFQEDVQREIDPAYLTNTLFSDGELRRDEFNLATAELIENSGPWGQLFPLPLFDGHFKILSQRLLAGKHLKLSLMPLFDKQEEQIPPLNPSIAIDGIFFNVNIEKWPDPTVTTIHIAYHLSSNEYLNKKTVQLMIQEIIE